MTVVARAGAAREYAEGWTDMAAQGFLRRPGLRAGALAAAAVAALAIAAGIVGGVSVSAHGSAHQVLADDGVVSSKN